MSAREHPVCDFCCSSDVRWSYPAQTFAIVALIGSSTQTSVSDARWAACDACRDAIEAGAPGVLMERSMLTFPSDRRTPVIQSLISAVHAAFFRYRTGPASPFPGDGESITARA